MDYRYMIDRLRRSQLNRRLLNGLKIHLLVTAEGHPVEMSRTPGSYNEAQSDVEGAMQTRPVEAALGATKAESGLPRGFLWTRMGGLRYRCPLAVVVHTFLYCHSRPAVGMPAAVSSRCSYRGGCSSPGYRIWMWSWMEGKHPHLHPFTPPHTNGMG